MSVTAFEGNKGRNTDMSRVKIGVVGCGGIAALHMEHLRRREDVDLVGCCDVDAERAEMLAARYDVPVFKNSLALYDDTRPEAVYITVPPEAHGAVETEAAARGIHLFIEKPIALELQTARHIGAEIRKAGVLCSVGYCFRYCDSIHAAHQLLKGKAVSLVSGACHGGMPGAHWWRKRARSGGQIVEQTTHLVDLVRYLCGPIAEVHAMAARGCMSQVADYDVDDSTVLTMRLKTGAIACISSTCVMRYSGRTFIEIVTPELAVTFDGDVARVHEDHRIVEHHNASDMYANETDAFIRALQQGRRTGIRSTYADALKTLRVTLAANDSIATGMPVTI